MTYRKTLFSYIVWAVYTGVCIMLLAFMGYFANVRYFAPGNPAQGMSVLCALAGVPLVLAVYFGVRTAAEAIHKKYTMQPHTAAMWEWFLAALILAIGILYQIRGMLQLLGELAAGTEFDFCNSPFYENARITVAQGERFADGAAAWLYESVLSFFLSFLGNKISSALILQLFLHILILILGYCAVRRLVGRIPACTMLLLLSYAMGSGMLEERLDPGELLFAMYLAGLLLTGAYCRLVAGAKAKRWVFLLTGSLLGVYIGLLLFLDLTAATLFLLLAGLFVTKEKTERAWMAVLPPFVVSLLAGTGVFALFYAGRGESLTKGWEILAGNYGNTSWIRLFNYEGWMNERAFAVLFLMIAGASFLTLEFFRQRQEMNFSVWILVSLVAATTPFAGNGLYPCWIGALFFWSVLAGLGIQNCVMGELRQVREALLARINDEVDEKTADGEQAAQEPDEKETPVEAKPRFIENPLPLPKKHVKKEMDYQYPVEESQMKYDIEVDEKDDFDLKD